MLLGHQKDEILPFVVTLVDLKGAMLSETSQMEKDKTCMISLIRELENKPTKEKQFINNEKQIGSYQWERGRGWNR